MKEKYFPTYVNEYYLVNDLTIKLMRRCTDGIKRFINYIRFDSKEECQEYWQNSCGA